MRHFGITTTDLFRQDAELAQRLWSEGFRPMQAMDLKEGNTVVFAHTMFGVNTGSVGYCTVRSIEKDEQSMTLVAKHTSGTAEADYEMEVWAK